VLEINGDSMRIRYESNNTMATVSMSTQSRILENINIEEQNFCPYDDEQLNSRFFFTVGYLSRNGYMEVFMASKSIVGFNDSYAQRKGHMPQQNQPGFYVHSDTNKWGVEMRLSFKIPQSCSVDEFNFGGDYSIRHSPNPEELRINSNQLCWCLLELGFDLGKDQLEDIIESNVPERYRPAFSKGKMLK